MKNDVIYGIIMAIVLISCSNIPKGHADSDNMRNADSFFYCFDEFEMAGIGEPIGNSCVTVIKNRDSIIVVCEEPENIFRKTYIQENGKWLSLQEYDTNRRVPQKDGKFPRYYYQWTGNDTIIQLESIRQLDKSEICTIVYAKSRERFVYVNLGKTDWSGKPIEELFNLSREVVRCYNSKYQDLGKVDHIVNLTKLGIPHEIGYLEFMVENDGKTLSYTAETVKETIRYEGKTLSSSISFGFEGFEEVRIKKDAEPSIDGIYRLQDVDVPPRIKRSGLTIQQYVINEAEMIKNDKYSHCAVVAEIVISESGKLLKAKINRSVNDLEDKKLLNICYHLPAMTPAMRKGRAVPVKMVISARF